MAIRTSQNGWPVHTNQLRLKVLSYVTGRVAGGDVLYLFAHFCAWFDKNIEPIRKRESWGYAYRAIRGQSTGYSNHASGTAIDLNAPDHPLGRDGTFTKAQEAKLRAQLKKYKGALRWGGDYAGRKDEMHFEINCSAAQLKRIVAGLKGKTIYKTSVKRLLANAKSKAPRSKSNDVIRLQRLLIHAGLLKLTSKDHEWGKYGPLTRAAVKKAQKKLGFTSKDADGYIGLATLKWLALKAEGSSAETQAVA